ncbi:hypothetical protein J6W78_01850 [bacterium]|nr:hypothetical protein [bacterium]
MKKFFLIFSALMFSVFFTACIQNSDEQYEVDDFQTDMDNDYYTVYEDEDLVSDDDTAGSVWDVNFSFLGTINDGNAENFNYGSGFLTYVDLEGNTISVSSFAWAIKKTMTLNSGHQVPILQIFFADDPSKKDDDGRVLYFVLQLEGSSVSSKSETYYINNDKLYKAKVKLNDETGKIEEICYIQEPDSTTGKVNIYTSNIRIGEELKVDGYANMLDMEVKECKTMN